MLNRLRVFPVGLAGQLIQLGNEVPRVMAVRLGIQYEQQDEAQLFWFQSKECLSVWDEFRQRWH